MWLIMNGVFFFIFECMQGILVYLLTDTHTWSFHMQINGMQKNVMVNVLISFNEENMFKDNGRHIWQYHCSFLNFHPICFYSGSEDLFMCALTFCKHLKTCFTVRKFYFFAISFVVIERYKLNWFRVKCVHNDHPKIVDTVDMWSVLVPLPIMKNLISSRVFLDK